MYKTIDENKEQEKYNQVVNKITPETLGLKPTSDFAQYAQQTIIDEDPEKAEEWASKGAIGIMEAGERFAIEFNGTYDNVVESDFAPWQKAGQRVLKKIDDQINKVYASDKVTQEQIKNPIKPVNIPIEIKDNADKPIPYNQVDLNKKIGFLEGLDNGLTSGDAIPFVGGWLKGKAIARYRQIASKIQNGDEITEGELRAFNFYNDKQKEKAIRGYTIGGQIGEAFLPSLLAFGGEIFVGGAALKYIGLAGKGIAGGVLLGKNLLKSKKVSKGLAKGVAFTAGHLAEAGVNAAVIEALPTGWGRIYSTYQERRLNDEMKITDRGTLIFSESIETPTKAFFKSLGQVYISYFAENTGALLGAPFKAGAKVINSAGAKQFAKIIKHNPALEKLIRKTAPVLAKTYEKLNNLPIKGKSVEWLKGQMKFDGFLEEVGEELLEDILNLALGTNNEERSLENYASKIVKTPEEWAVLCGVIGLQGTVLSVAGNTLGDMMQANGVEFNNIAKVLTNSTEAEKIEYIDEAIKKGDIKIKENAIFVDKDLAVETIASQWIKENKSFKKVDGTADEEKINKTANVIASALEKISEKTGIDLETLVNEEKPQVFQSDNDGEVVDGVLQGRVEQTQFQVAPKTSTKEFKEWFGESQVVNEKGKPLVVYHGTEDQYGFNAFEMENAKSEQAFFFTSKESHAQEYAYDFGNDEQGRVMPVYLKMDNPLIIDAQGKKYSNSDTENWIDQAYEDAKDGIIVKNIVDPKYNDTEDKDKYLTDSYLVFNPEQIKSVENKGTFDKKNPNIYYQADTAKNVVDLTGDFTGTPTIESVKSYINELIESGKKFATLSPDFVVDIKGGKRVKKKLANDGNYKKLNAAKNNRHNKYIMSLEKLLEGAEYTGSKENTKKDKKPNIEKYHYFKTNLKINDKIYELIFDTEEYKGEKISSEGQHAKRAFKNPSKDTNIITGNSKNINPKTVHLYNVTEIKKGVPLAKTAISDNANSFNPDGNIYYKKKIAHNFDQLLKTTGYQDSVYFAADAAKIDAGAEAQIKSNIETVLKAGPKDKILRRNIKLGSASARIKEINPKIKDIRISPNYARILNENGNNAILSQLSSLLQNPLAVMKPIANNSKGISVVVEYSKSEQLRGIAKIDLELKSAGVGDKKTHYYSVKKVKSNYRKADFNNLFREMLTQNKLLKVDKSNTSTLEKYLNKLSIPEKRNTPFKKEFVKGAFIADKNIIELFRTADESAIIHELAHWWLSTIEKYAENTEEMMLDMAEIRKFLGNNGEKFTEQQHEKFARGFEAYIRSGNGRTNRLKRIFEDFKNFLLDIYSSITELGFTEDELPQIEAVFERLLTTENERVKKDVFEKIDDLSDAIQQVKNNQDQELEELERIYTDNKERIERNAKVKEMTQEFLNKAERVASKENPEVKAYKERYKKVTLSILEVATGYPRQFIANPKNWEKIQDKIGNIDDPFSSGEGFQAEWSEFYSDTGVSYDTMDTRGNEILAQLAFDVLTDGSFQPLNMRYEDIDQFFGKYEYLINKVKTSRGNQRIAALEATVSLFENIPSMPDEAVQDMMRMYSELDNEFDNLDKEKKDEFEKRRYPNLPVAIQLGSFLSRKIGDLRIYDKEIGYKRAVNKSDSLYSLIKNTDSVFKAQEALCKINNYIIQDIENKQKLILHKEIQKQVKVGSRLVKTSGIKKGKFDWQTNTIFQKLKDLNKFKKNTALKEYLEVIQASPENVAFGEARENYKENSIEIREFKNDFQSNLERKFLEYRANNVNDGNVALMRSLLEDIVTLKFEGIRAKSEEEFAKKTEKFNLENNLIEKLGANDEFTKLGTKWIEATKSLGNWESLLNALFDKETSEKYSLLYEESQRDVYARNKVLQLYDAMRKIYGLEEDKGIKKVITTAIDYDNAQQIINLLKQFEEEKHNYISYTFDQNARGKFIATNIELSKANIMMYYGWSLNPQLKQRLMTEFCPMEEYEGQAEEVLEEMFSILTENDKKVMWEMIKICDEIYQDTNEIYIRQFGLSLPYTENYLPSKAERVLSEVDMMHESIVRSNNPSFIKQRINCRFIQMAKTTPLEVILPHINKSANYVEVSERVTFLNKLFKTNILKNKMLEIYGQKDGKELYYMLLNQLAASTYTTNAQGLSLAKDLVDNVSSSIIPASIGGSLKVMFGQLLSVVNYAENMPAGEWAKGFLQALGKPKETVQYMLQAVPYLESRIASNSQNEVLASITNEADRFRNIKNFFTMNTRWGDVYAIALGGKPFYDFLLSKAKKEGKTEEEAKVLAAEALKQFVLHTLRTQQAGVPSSTSQWQKDQSRHFLTRIFFAFRNTEIQFERKVIDANLQLRRGDISASQWFKTVFIYKIMNPIMFTSWLTNLGLLQVSRALFVGDDPEDELLNLMGDGVLAILMSSCNAYGMAGMLVSAVIQWAFSKMGNKGKYFESAVPVLSDFEDSIGKLFTKKEVTLADWVDAAAFVGETRAGIPARKLVNFAGGVGDVTQGEYGIGLTRMFGIGRYTATQAWTGEPPEKRK